MMRLRIRTDWFKYILLYGLLFFCSMNFSAKFFYFVYATLIALMLIHRKMLINKESLVYMALGFLMAIYNIDEGVLSMLRCMSHFSLYIVGYNMTVFSMIKRLDDTEENMVSVEKTAYGILISICAGSFVHYMLNAITNTDKLMGRNTIDVWSGEVMAATVQAAIASLMLGFAVAIIYKPTKKVFRYLGIASVTCMLAYNLVLAGRTMIVIFYVVFMLGFIYTSKVNRTKIERLKLVIGIISALVVVVLMIIYNVGGIQDYILESNLFERFGVSQQSFITDLYRASNKISYLLNGWKYPFGGLNMLKQYGYAHDLLLDGYDEYGFIVFTILVSILVLGISSLYKLIRYTDYSHQFKLAVLCIYCSVLLEFCVEPILAGMAWLFACYSLINGCLNGMNYSHSLTKVGIRDESFTN